MANTPNLDLVKPAGTDKALVSVINSNSDKIDGGFGTLSEQIGTYNLGTFTSLADLQTAITTYANGSSMKDYQSKNFVFTPNFQSDYFTAQSVYFGTIVRITTNRLSIIFQNHGDVDALVRAVNKVGTWYWDKFALESELAKFSEYGHMSSSDVADVVAKLISNMTTDGQYVFTFSWTGHSGGAIAQCARCYQGSITKFNGVITTADGHTYTFVKNSDSGTTTIRELATKDETQY